MSRITNANRPLIESIAASIESYAVQLGILPEQIHSLKHTHRVIVLPQMRGYAIEPSTLGGSFGYIGSTEKEMLQRLDLIRNALHLAASAIEGTHDKAGQATWARDKQSAAQAIEGARQAALGDSNDAEIEALQECRDVLATIVGIDLDGDNR